MSTTSPKPSPVSMETAVQDGRQVTVVRDAAGNIAYPTHVPPATEPLHHGAPLRVEDDEAAGTTGPRRPVHAASKRWATELPQQSDDPVTVLRPARTNIPEMAREQDKQAPGEPSSSESSSDEEAEGEQARLPKKKRKQQAKKRADEDDDRYRRFHIGNDHYRTKGKISKRDGRLNISLHDTSNTGYLAKALGTAARKMAPLTKPLSEATTTASSTGSSTTARPDHDHGRHEASQQPLPSKVPTREQLPPPPRLNIVIMVIGSRGDAQPFLAIARLLHTRYGHRVRIATHPAFRTFVTDSCPGVEFFSVGGDPSELMSFMVKNPGMIPTLSSVKAGDVGRRRAAMAGMFAGFWRACINTADDEGDPRNVAMMGVRDPFVADVIIANPPSFAHVHCAEALGVPVHLMFTFPYTPTQAFPHPLARVKRSNVDPGYTNWISYPLVEMMVWQGLGDLVNEFRTRTLGLDPVSTLWAPGATYRLHVPFTYLWSPGLVPKPPDWGDEVDVAGFVFLDLASSFDPPEALTKFLDEGGEPPVYIGFGSIVVDDADRFTQMIFEAVKLAGVRALVSKGWGGLGGDSLDVPPEVFMLDNTPHDWLFPRVRACVIHGGAGTTAIALKCGKPTMIVPFFGDQHFWGSMVGNAGAGPEPVPYKHLSAEKLADGIRYCITAEAREAAEGIARAIEKEGDGAENACEAFHRSLVLQGQGSMRCSILPDRVAVWQMKKTGLRLSPVAAELLVKRGLVSWKKLRLLRHNEWNDFEGPGEPLTGAAGSLMSSVGNIFRGIGGVPYRIGKGAKKRKEKRKKRESAQSQEGKEGGDAGSGEGKQEPGNSTPDGPDQKQPKEANEGTNVPQIETTTTHAIHRRGTASTTATNPAEDVVRQVGRGAAKSAAALVRTPVDLSLALAQGFHNAPRLYGDDTVRRPTRVTGIRSGLRAARHEFAYGIYDGFTGVVRLPAHGLRDDGLRGLVSGVGMGLTGFVLKDIAAVIGPVGYTLRGVVKQVERRRQPGKYIRRARVVQGSRELAGVPQGERVQRERQVVEGWRLMRQLWEEMKRAERRREKHLRWRLSGTARRLRRSTEWNTVFENTEVARRALDALKRGDGLDSVLGKGDYATTGEKPTLAAPDDEQTLNVKASSDATEEAKNNSRGTGSAHDSAHDIPTDELVSGKAGPQNDEENENPFSEATPAIVENKAENRQTMEALQLQASG